MTTTIKERPILFSGPMVRAILAGHKTQTRRLLKPQPRWNEESQRWEIPTRGGVAWLHIEEHNTSTGESSARNGLFEETIQRLCRCPYPVGTRLYVRETWMVTSDAELRFQATPDEIFHVGGRGEGPGFTQLDKWRPSIHMPRWASRLTLEVTSVRVERLQDIGEEGILAEGLDNYTIERIIAPTAQRFKTQDECWISGWNEGLSFCYSCAEKKLGELQKQKPDEEYFITVGHSEEGDSQAFCETCQAALHNSYTDYCCEYEFHHFDSNPFNSDSPGDCHSLYQILQTIPWEGHKLSKDLHRLSWRALWNSLNTAPGTTWEDDPWVWVIGFKRL